MTTPRSGPFRPGPGKRPPYLAGRQAEQALLRDWLGDLADGAAPPSEVVLHGPRGNGKTTLLHWLEREVDAEPKVDSVWLTPSSFHGEQELVSRLLPKTPWWRLSPGPIANRRPLRGREMETISAVESALTARAKRRSFVLLLDEAHTLTPDIGRIVLNASQSVGARLPFLLVLAGTPGLRAVLRLMEASFRNCARAIPVGRLTDEAAREAVLRPFADEGVPITEEALAHILRESDGYPYFLQLWGLSVWRQARRGSEPPSGVTRADVAAAQPDFDGQREIYFRDRYDEIRNAQRLGPAVALAEAFSEAPLLDDRGLEAALRRGLGEGASPEEIRAMEEFFHLLGFIWRPGTGVVWEPGIPSLMDYIRETAPTPPQRRRGRSRVENGKRHVVIRRLPEIEQPFDSPCPRPAPGGWRRLGAGGPRFGGHHSGDHGDAATALPRSERRGPAARYDIRHEGAGDAAERGDPPHGGAGVRAGGGRGLRAPLRRGRGRGARFRGAPFRPFRRRPFRPHGRGRARRA